MRKYADCERALQETVARFGRLDILVNCAAGNFLATAEELSSNGFRTGASYEATFSVNERCLRMGLRYCRQVQVGSSAGPGQRSKVVHERTDRACVACRAGE